MGVMRCCLTAAQDLCLIHFSKAVQFPKRTNNQLAAAGHLLNPRCSIYRFRQLCFDFCKKDLVVCLVELIGWYQVVGEVYTLICWTKRLGRSGRSLFGCNKTRVACNQRLFNNLPSSALVANA